MRDLPNDQGALKASYKHNAVNIQEIQKENLEGKRGVSFRACFGSAMHKRTLSAKKRKRK